MMRNSLRTLVLTAALTLGGCADATGPELPSVISVCETNTGRVCATWTRSGDGYDAQFDQGSVARIEVENFRDEFVHFSRTDYAGTSEGMTAVYMGTVTGTGVERGLVTWTHNGVTFSGYWTADW